MTAPVNFALWIDEDKIAVRFVSARVLGRLKTGHLMGGDYGDGVIRIARYDLRGSMRAVLLHEIGHYLVQRVELRAKDATEEEIVDLLSWVPAILVDPRNGALRAFLGIA